jgi:hypothetical protein
LSLKFVGAGLVPALYLSSIQSNQHGYHNNRAGTRPAPTTLRLCGEFLFFLICFFITFARGSSDDIITQVSHPYNSLKMSKDDKKYLIESISCIKYLNI